VARADHLERQRAQALERLQVAGQVLGHEHAALAEHRVAAEARRSGHEREVVRSVARHGVGDERPEAIAVGEAHVGGQAARGHRRAPEPLAQRQHTLDVVGVIVRDGDPAGPAARLDLRRHRVEVRGEVRAGVDHPGGVAADHPRVRARQRVRAGVVGPQAGDAEPREVPLGAQRGTSR